MHFLEKRSQPDVSDLQEMTVRTTYYFKLLRTSPELAEDYWKFVERGYRERGWEPHEINELSTDAEERIKEVAMLELSYLPESQPAMTKIGGDA